jgi:hypothetical protein
MPFGQDRPVQHRSVPVNFIEDAAKDELHPAASERGLAIRAMKPFAGGMIDNADIAFKFLRQYPDVLPQALPECDADRSPRLDLPLDRRAFSE